MPTPLGDDLLNPSSTFAHSSSATSPVLPIHVAQHQQLLAQHNRSGAEGEGHELQHIDTRHAQGEGSQRGRRHSRHLSHSYSSGNKGNSVSSPSRDQHSDSEASDTQMSNKKRRSTSNQSNRPASSSSSDTIGHDGHSTGTMNGQVEYRRKNQSQDSPVADRERLMQHESFSLDQEPPRTPIHSSSSIGFRDLPLKDRRNFLLLVLLYFLQGIPMGLATGSVPFLLKSHMSYGQIGVFSLASYPYSLKLLWSPIVDAVWSPKVGRRKSWIMPIQLLSGLGMIWLGGRVQEMMIKAGEDNGAGVWGFTWWWFFLVFMCATQDIAVDGWALTLLSPENLSYASTAQTVGLTAGHFMSYTVFLAFNAPDFANRWFRKIPKPEGVMTLGGYLTFWGWIYILVTIGLAVFKREERTKDRDGIKEVYKVMWGILKLKNIQTIIVLHLIAKIGFQANDAVTNLKLLDKGFSQEDMALTVLIDFPFEISLGYLAGKWSSTMPPMQLWCWAFVGRLAAAVIAQLTVMVFPANGVNTWYFLFIISEHILSTFTSTVMFVAISAFHAKIADPVIGGTYMTLLATVSNLGGTFPRFFILKLVDLFTVATCIPPTVSPAADSLKPGVSPITSAFSCVLEADKHRCIDGGGACVIQRDGYYITNIICVVVGAVTFWSFIKPAALRLQALPLRAWRLVG